ncbi:MAG TPA: hypothetical protein VIY48_13600, partial [Candidatus Paceibacterota bacterium]
RASSIQKKLNDSEKAAIKAHSDYQDEFNKLREEVAAGEEIGLPDHVIKAIAEEADDPYEVTYHLMKNRDELRRFTSLNAKEAVREVIKLDTKLAVKPEAPAPEKKPARTAAPEPPKPVSQRAAVPVFDVYDEKATSAEEWAKQRNKQVYGR